MNKIFFFLLLPVILLLCSCERENTRSPWLRVGTNAEYPPYCFYEGTTLTGFDLDVMQQIAERLHYDIDIRDYSFDALLPELQVGSIDVIAAGMTATAQRASRIAFTRPHVMADALVLVSRQNRPIVSLEELAGKQLVVNDGFYAEQLASSWHNVRLIRLPTTADAFLALAINRADAFLTAKSTFRAYEEKNPNHLFQTSSLDRLQEGISFGLAKNSPFFEPIQGVLDEMEADGTLEALRKRWKL